MRLPARLLLLLLLGPGEAAAQCIGTRIAWPAANPLWDFCFRRPSQTSYLANGGGLEINDVKYRGIPVLAAAHIPILNVKYVAGGCGGAGSCYRDWFDQEERFECSPVTGPGQCSGTAVPATTVCQHPGADSGSFVGVAVEDLGDRLKLTSQAQAGWYRYIPVWEFFRDGSLRARFDASSIDNGCVAYTHHHHSYFRLDLDVNGSSGNLLDLVLPGGGTQRISSERSFIDSGSSRSHWRASKPGSPFAVEVLRNPEDGAAGDPPAIPNDFPIADGWALAYDPAELDDSAVTGGCAAGLDAFLNGESVESADIVLWVRASALHQGEPGGNATDCSMVGPTIRVTGVPSAPASFHTIAPCRMVDTRAAPGPYGAPALAPGPDRSFVLTGPCGIPATARAVSANLTVVAPDSGGHLSIWPAGGALPVTSVINFGPGQTRANNALLELGASGAVLIRSVLPAGSLHFVLDVNGYFE